MIIEARECKISFHFSTGGEFGTGILFENKQIKKMIFLKMKTVKQSQKVIGE